MNTWKKSSCTATLWFVFVFLCFFPIIITVTFLKLFACSFTLGPTILLVTLLIDVRVDAKRFLWNYRRPVAYKAQDIGYLKF